MSEEKKEVVLLHVYDLSMGMVSQISTSLIGKHVEAVYHTGVVAFGKEYFYGSGAGIQSGTPATTSYGKPIQVLEMGETEMDHDLLQDLLENLQEQFHGDRYHLLHNNCNHFSQELINFLVGKDIPQHILNLPQEIMSTPMGSFFANLISNLVESGKQPNMAQTPSNDDSEEAWA